MLYNEKNSADWRVLWERENTKVAHFSGLPTRRESLREMHTQAVLRQATWCDAFVSSDTTQIPHTLVLLSTFMCLNYRCISGTQDCRYSLPSVAVTQHSNRKKTPHSWDNILASSSCSVISNCSPQGKKNTFVEFFVLIYSIKNINCILLFTVRGRKEIILFT